jgi:PAS domain S-box-containing protein
MAFFQRLVLPEDWPHVEATMQAHLRGDTPASDVEYRMVTASGDLRWIRGRGRVVTRDAAGAPLRMIGHITDITARKQAEAERLQQMANSHAITQSDFIGLVRVENRTIQWANRAFHAMFGYREGELVGQPTRLLFPDDQSHARFGEIILPTLQRNEVFHGELRQRRKDGSLGWYQFNVSRLAAVGDVSVGAVIDISEHRHLARELRATSQRQRILLDLLPQFVWIMDRYSVYLDANLALAQALGLEPEGLLGHTAHDFYPPELADKYRADDRRIMASGVSERFEEHWPQNGLTRILRTTKIPLKDDHGEVYGIRSEERRVGKECRRLCRSRWSPYH